MISQILLDKIVENIVPEKYKPGRSKNKRIIAINCVSSSKIIGIRKSYHPNKNVPDKHMWAFSLNLGDVYLDQDYNHKYIMYINENIEDEEELSFILLNQLGYIDLYLNYPNCKKVDVSLYGDFFAVDILKDIMGQKKAKELAEKYGSIKGE